MAVTAYIAFQQHDGWLDFGICRSIFRRTRNP